MSVEPETLRNWLTRHLQRPVEPTDELALPFPPDDAEVVGEAADFLCAAALVRGRIGAGGYALVYVKCDGAAFAEACWRERDPVLSDRRYWRLSRCEHLTPAEAAAVCRNGGFRVPAELATEFAALGGAIPAEGPPADAARRQRRAVGGRPPVRPEVEAVYERVWREKTVGVGAKGLFLRLKLDVAFAQAVRRAGLTLSENTVRAALEAKRRRDSRPRA